MLKDTFLWCGWMVLDKVDLKLIPIPAWLKLELELSLAKKVA